MIGLRWDIRVLNHLEAEIFMRTEVNKNIKELKKGEKYEKI